MADQDADQTLLTRAISGDRAAFSALYQRHVRGVYWQAYSVVRDGNTAEDVTQDVFITMWRKIGFISIVGDSVLPWLLTTARFTALNAHRKALRSSVGIDQEATDPVTTEDLLEASLIQAEINKAVSGLSPIDREVYELCVDGDCTYEQAAQQLGVSHAAVRNRVSRVRRRLRTDLRFLKESS